MEIAKEKRQFHTLKKKVVFFVGSLNAHRTSKICSQRRMIHSVQAHQPCLSESILVVDPLLFLFCGRCFRYVVHCARWQFVVKIYVSICHPSTNSFIYHKTSITLNKNIFFSIRFVLFFSSLRLNSLFAQFDLPSKNSKLPKKCVEKKKHAHKYVSNLNWMWHGRVESVRGSTKKTDMNPRKLMSLMWQAEWAKRNLTN